METGCAIESDHPLVRTEQVELLKRIVTAKLQPPEPLLERLINHKSWLVSRAAYGLGGKLSMNGSRQELLRRDHNTDDEKERLIIINALGQRRLAQKVEMLSAELLIAQSSGTPSAGHWPATAKPRA